MVAPRPGWPSQTASGAKKFSMASKSPTFTASSSLRESSARSGVVDSSGISLRPLLGKALGGCTGLFDVDIERRPYDQSIHPLGDARVPQLHVAAAANWTALQHDHAKADSVAEVKHL